MPAISAPPRPSSRNTPPLGRRAGAGPGPTGSAPRDFAMNAGANTSRPYVATSLLFMAGIALLLYSLRQGLLIGQIAAPILTIGAIHGLWRGGFRKIMLLAVSVGLFYLVFTYPAFADPLIQKVAGNSSGFISGLITAAAAIVLYLFSMVMIGRFRRRHIANRTGRLRVDRLVGSAIGFAEGAFIVLAICWTAVMVRPHAEVVRDSRDVSADSFQHQAADTIVRLAREAQTPPLAPVVKATNLIERTPALRDAIHEFNTTGSIDLSHLDPQTAARLDDLTKQMSKGEYANLNELLQSAERNRKAQEELHRRLPTSNGHRP